MKLLTKDRSSAKGRQLCMQLHPPEADKYLCSNLFVFNKYSKQYKTKPCISIILNRSVL